MPRSFRLLVLFAVMSIAAFAQTATILGNVTDNTGAVVPGATVTITNTATQVQRVLQTNSAGWLTSVAFNRSAGPFAHSSRRL